MQLCTTEVRGFCGGSDHSKSHVSGGRLICDTAYYTDSICLKMKVWPTYRGVAVVVLWNTLRPPYRGQANRAPLVRTRGALGARSQAQVIITPGESKSRTEACLATPPQVEWSAVLPPSLRRPQFQPKPAEQLWCQNAAGPAARGLRGVAVLRGGGRVQR